MVDHMSGMEGCTVQYVHLFSFTNSNLEVKVISFIGQLCVVSVVRCWRWTTCWGSKDAQQSI